MTTLTSANTTPIEDRNRILALIEEAQSATEGTLQGLPESSVGSKEHKRLVKIHKSLMQAWQSAYALKIGKK